LPPTSGLPLDAQAADWFSGAALPPGADPIAQAYAGHQFGGFSSQLGDGRAHLLGEVLAPKGRRFDIQLKGSGRTPFSRGGDGKAAVGPMLREYLISEFMAAMGVPTTRSLAVVATGERSGVRPSFPAPSCPGRRQPLASRHLPVLRGTGRAGKVKALADHAIARHYPDLAGSKTPYLAFLDAVIARQAADRRMDGPWLHPRRDEHRQHGDQGETIDYGPCAFMEGYAPGTVFSSIDHQGRYAYANQPLILGWNLARLAETLVPLLDPIPTGRRHRQRPLAGIAGATGPNGWR
jgi:uncharacterized protein YdiU (UPF0061 family)